MESKPTERTEGLYYYETSFDKFNYITRRDVTDTAGKKLGTFFIVSNPNNYSRDALFPEFFRQFKADRSGKLTDLFQCSVYKQAGLVSPPGNYPFAIWLDDNEVPKEGFHPKQQWRI